MFVCPICVFQYWTKESEYSVFKITLEFSVEECKEIVVIQLCITKEEKPQILSAANICCI